MKNVLFIVYYFPPMGSSGVQRPLKFVKYLPDYGWKPIILAPQPGTYHTFDESLLDDLKGREYDIHRIKANTPFHIGSGKARELDIPDFIARYLRVVSQFFWLPDNKTGWIKPAIKKGGEIIANQKIDLIYSTAPPYSNHLIAAELKQRHRIPTVMDMRDEWLESPLTSYPTLFHKRKMAKIERETLSASDLITVINEPIQKSISGRLNHNKSVKIIRHGFDPDNFNTVRDKFDAYKPGKLKFLYSGIFYGERTPETFIKAAAKAIKQHPELKKDLELQFQGGLEQVYLDLISQLQLDNIVVNYGYIPHEKAVQNLLKADILWFIIGHTQFSDSITTGKLFEYFGAGKPILGLVPKGAGRVLLKKYKSSYIAEPNDIASVTQKIIKIWKDWKNARFIQPDISFVEKYNRKKITGHLADTFDKLLKK